MPKSYDLEAGTCEIVNGDAGRPAFVDFTRDGKALRVVLDAGERKTVTLAGATRLVTSDVVQIIEGDQP